MCLFLTCEYILAQLEWYVSHEVQSQFIQHHLQHVINLGKDAQTGQVIVLSTLNSNDDTSDGQSPS
jgi:hypothetical protein